MLKWCRLKLRGESGPGARRRGDRLVCKDGHCNMELGNLAAGGRPRFALLVDYWTTMVELRWRYKTAAFLLAFLGSWFLFGLIWFAICRLHGDLPGSQPPQDHVPCVVNVHGLTTAFLFSLETQVTIGYGYRYVTERCPEAVALLVLQSLSGVVINAFMCGAVMAKIAAPKRRGKTVAFSDRAVVCVRSERLCLVIRVANVRRSLLIGSHVYGKLLRTTPTQAGETLIMEQRNVSFSVDAGAGDALFFIAPLAIYHVMDESSPLFGLSRSDLSGGDTFELVVFLDGTVEATGGSCQVRTSYLPDEILWGHRFLPIVSTSKDGKHRVDFGNFNKSVEVDTPHCATCMQGDQSDDKVDVENVGEGLDNPAFDVTSVVDETKM
ncbi:ATP-sensitive inward rectifier potassium channel 1 [Lethenteron reissneri]|uniref:ATP-sensitive inward rectifier potassium channel 1 n=1 Tax=Lethenteron reissneri TaxID=7753 RepID=UPI002AB62A0B|nr:ATP-sensitive inward rectifier potassium channel 1 [Lethenteron reissneri]